MQEEPEVAGIAGKMSSRWQYVLDKMIPHLMMRWIAFTISFSLYVLRVYYLNGWYIVTYGLGIYLLNQLLGFISPQVSFHIYHRCFLNNALCDYKDAKRIIVSRSVDKIGFFYGLYSQQ